MIRWGWVAIAYGLLGAIALIAAQLWRGTWPVVYPEPWLVLEPAVAHAYSLLLGLALAALVVLSTRFSVERFTWAQRLHGELQPFARAVSSAGIAWLAIFSGSGEELLFRGLLQPSLGLLGQALVFGFLHQIRGQSRWVWVTWATLVGVALGSIFQLTGSLLGPIAAHMTINWMNLSYLKSHDREPPRKPLGGLLGERG